MTFQQMVANLLVALILGALIGIEREFAGKEAGIRTAMLVAGGSAIFSMIGLILPYLIAQTPENLTEILARNSGFITVIANIVVGIGFLGAGIIIKTEEHIHGLTTAAAIWTTAAIGVLAGLGLTEFAVVATILVAGLLYFTRKIRVSEKIDKIN